LFWRTSALNDTDLQTSASPCVTIDDCRTPGQVCWRQRCFLQAGTECTFPSDCLSGRCRPPCDPGAYNYPCVSDNDCSGKFCLNGLCGKNRAFIPCDVNSDCLSWRCANPFSPQGKTCELSALGSPCAYFGDCVGQNCVNHVCARGCGGTPCTFSSDCLSGSCNSQHQCDPSAKC